MVTPFIRSRGRGWSMTVNKMRLNGVQYDIADWIAGDLEGRENAEGNKRTGRVSSGLDFARKAVGIFFKIAKLTN